MKLEQHRILVTGGAGFIGSHLVDALSDCRQVRIIDNFSTGRRENVEHHSGKSNIQVIEGSIQDSATVAQAMAGIDVVFHLACRGVRHSIGNPVESHEVNATGTLTLLQAAREAKVQRFIHISTSEVYGTARYTPMDEQHPCLPETAYGAAKLAGEAYSRAYFRTYGVPTVIVRPFNNFGPRSHHEGDAGEVIPRFCVWALNNQSPAIFGSGDQTRDFIYVEDTAYWLRRIAACDAVIGETINLGTGVETSVRDLARLVCQEAGRPELEPVHLPPRPGDVQRHLAGVEKARALVGFEPRSTVRHGIRKLIDYLKSRPQGIASMLKETRTVNWTEAA